ncbi:MAG TPA: sugar ABC transporter substrate-binding protein [Thermomicrobiales bacterium]|jgi:multiple sugar transport system substrate-binding protein|nr:sugar ABC transporter substrate-binding protein [Thermomicrobiales bacterium]
MSRSSSGQSWSSRRLDRRRLAGAAGLSLGALGALPLIASAQDATPGSGTPAAPLVPEITPYGGEEATLTYGFWDTAQEPAIDEQIAAFNAVYPNITIEKQIVPWANYWTQLQTAVSGGAAFDVFWMNATSFPPYAAAGSLLPINQIIGGDGIAVDRLPQTLVEPYAAGGIQYGVPRDFDAIAIYYNKTLFDDAGVAYPTAEWTWDDFRAAAEQLTNTDAGIWGVGLQTSFQETWINFVYQNDGQLLSDDLSEVVLNQPAGDEAIQYITRFFTDGLTPSIAIQQSNPVADTLFPAGQVAFMPGGSFRAGTYGALDLNLGVAPLPRKVRQATVTAGVANVIWSGTSNPGAALEWVKYLHGDEAEQILGASGSTIPALAGTQQGWVESVPNLDLQVFVDAAQNYGFGFDWPQGVGDWLTAVQDVLVDGWAGNIPVEEISTRATEAGNAILRA